MCGRTTLKEIGGIAYTLLLLLLILLLVLGPDIDLWLSHLYIDAMSSPNNVGNLFLPLSEKKV